MEEEREREGKGRRERREGGKKRGRRQDTYNVHE